MLRDALADHEASTSLVIADVMRTRLSGLDPLPGKVVANLPYGVATPAILKTIDELPEAKLWCVMVQREIAARLAAKPGTKAYGIPSVLVQLACEVEVVRPISRKVFRPGAERRLRARADAPDRARAVRRAGRAGAGGVRAPAQGARALAGGGRRAGRHPGSGARGARGAWGIRPTRGPRRSRPQEFAQLERELERPG